MVKILKIHYCTIAFFLAGFISAVQAAPVLMLDIKNHDVELGRPVNAEIIAISFEQDISSIQLSPLMNLFGVNIDYSVSNSTDSRWPGKNVQLLGLKLYPRQTGTLTIPRLQLNQVYSNKHKITVQPGIYPAPRLEVSTTSIQAKQQFNIVITYNSSSATARIEPDTQKKIPGFEVVHLPFQRKKINNKEYQLKTGWSLQALNPGIKNIDLPPVLYSVSSNVRKRFYFPVLKLNIESLPGYISPVVPVGDFSLKQLSRPGYLQNTNTVYYWKLKLSGNVNTLLHLPVLSRYLNQPDNIDFFPFEKTTVTKFINNKIITEAEFTIPYKIISSGITQLPAIKIQYYDPVSRKITDATINNQITLAFSPTLKFIIILLLFGLLIMLTRLIISLLKKQYFLFLNKKSAIRILETAKDFSEIRIALRYFSRGKFNKENITVRKIALYIQKIYPRANKDKLESLFDEINQGLYAKKDIDPEKTAHQLLTLMKSRRNFNAL